MTAPCRERLLRKDLAPSQTPVNAIVATIVPVLFVLLVDVNPTQTGSHLVVHYPANLNALYALVSFATSGIYLAFLLTVIGSGIARARGWKPSGDFRSASGACR